jgi:hypothetical protein
VWLYWNDTTAFTSSVRGINSFAGINSFREQEQSLGKVGSFSVETWLVELGLVDSLDRCLEVFQLAPKNCKHTVVAGVK